MSKQAVLLIHGIGEQRPMDTLRGFVDTVWTSDASQQRQHGPDVAGRLGSGLPVNGQTGDQTPWPLRVIQVATMLLLEGVVITAIRWSGLTAQLRFLRRAKP